MKKIYNLFTELFYVFPIHFIGLFIITLSLTVFNTLTVIAVVPITDFLVSSGGKNLSNISVLLQNFLSFLDINLTFGVSIVFFSILIICTTLISILSEHFLLKIKYAFI